MIRLALRRVWRASLRRLAGLRSSPFPAVQPPRHVFNAQGHRRNDAAALRCVRQMVGARRQGPQVICICCNYLHRAKVQYDDPRYL